MREAGTYEREKDKWKHFSFRPVVFPLLSPRATIISNIIWNRNYAFFNAARPCIIWNRNYAFFKFNAARPGPGMFLDGFPIHFKKRMRSGLSLVEVKTGKGILFIEFPKDYAPDN